MKINLQSGQTLIEALVATVIVAVVLTAIVSGVTLSVKNSQFSRNQALATRFTQEAVESIRFYRDDSGWTSFFNEILANQNNKIYCLVDLPDNGAEFLALNSGNCTTAQKIDGIFTRQASFTSQTLSDPIGVTVTVTWDQGGIIHQSTSTTILTQWSRT